MVGSLKESRRPVCRRGKRTSALRLLETARYRLLSIVKADASVPPEGAKLSTTSSRSPRQAWDERAQGGLRRFARAVDEVHLHQAARGVGRLAGQPFELPAARAPPQCLVRRKVRSIPAVQQGVGMQVGEGKPLLPRACDHTEGAPASTIEGLEWFEQASVPGAAGTMAPRGLRRPADALPPLPGAASCSPKPSSPLAVAQSAHRPSGG